MSQTFRLMKIIADDVGYQGDISALIEKNRRNIWNAKCVTYMVLQLAAGLLLYPRLQHTLSVYHFLFYCCLPLTDRLAVDTKMTMLSRYPDNATLSR